jgi:hypothetical protein
LEFGQKLDRPLHLSFKRFFPLRTHLSPSRADCRGSCHTRASHHDCVIVPRVDGTDRPYHSVCHLQPVCPIRSIRPT